MSWALVLGFSLAISALNSLLYRILINKKQLEAFCKKGKELSSALKVNPSHRLLKKWVQLQLEQFKLSLKAHTASFALFGVSILWVNYAWSGLYLSLPFALPLVGSTLKAFWVFLLSSMLFSLMLQRIVK